MTPTVYSLSVHAEYRCRHSGACCTAGWSIPVEPAIRALARADVITPDANGVCPFYDRPSGLCRLHRDHGEAQLPASCHHFPRLALIDDRGIFVSLSHFCPSAADLLFTPAPLTIVENPPAFPASRGYEGLDARGEWPPLLRADVLFDRESYTRWERFVVRTLDGAGTIEDAFEQIATAAERLRAWRSEASDFTTFAATVLEAAPGRAGNRLPLDSGLDALARYARYRSSDAHQHVRRMVSVPLGPARLPEGAEDAFAEYAAPVWPQHPAVRRYLAARSFASWTAYQTRGIRALVAEVLLAEALVRMEAGRVCAANQRSLDRDALKAAIRAADYLLLHLARRDALTAWLAEAEGAKGPVRSD